MAFTRVGADWDMQDPASATMVYTATGTTLAAGNLLEGIVVWNGNGESVTSIVDDMGNTYTIEDDVSGAIYRGVSFHKANILGGANPTFTITWSGSVTNHRLGFRQWSGAATSSVVAASVGSAQSAPATSANAITSTAATPSENNCLVTGWSSGDLLDAVAGTGFTQDNSIGLSGDGGVTVASEYLIQGAAASVAATFTDSTGAQNIITLMMAFKLPGAPPVTADFGGPSVPFFKVRMRQY